MAYDWKTEIPGVYGLHADDCPKRHGGRCTCGVLGYRSIVRDPSTQGRLYSPLFNTKQSARSWSSDRLEAVRPGQRTTTAELPTREIGGHDDDASVDEVVDEFLKAARHGAVRDQLGRPLGRSEQTAVSWALNRGLTPEFGRMQLSDVDRRHVQQMLDELAEGGWGPGQVGSVAAALRLLYVYAIQQRLVFDFSPVEGLEPGPQPAEQEPAAADEEAPGSDAEQEAPGSDAEQEAPGSEASERGIPERIFWMSVKAMGLAFALIAVVLVAQSL
jgi:hypothetical protein